MWCDAVPMDACHLLLGWPWQFDQNVTWSRRANVYSFVLNNRKFNRLPQPLDEGISSLSACLTIAKFEHKFEGAVMNIALQ